MGWWDIKDAFGVNKAWLENPSFSPMIFPSKHHEQFADFPATIDDTKR
jgi:hypothetical protein